LASVRRQVSGCGLCNKRSPFKCVVKCRGNNNIIIIIMYSKDTVGINLRSIRLQDGVSLTLRQKDIDGGGPSPSRERSRCPCGRTRKPSESYRHLPKAATGIPVKPMTRTVAVRVEGDRDLLAAERRPRAAFDQPIDEWWWTVDDHGFR